MLTTILAVLILSVAIWQQRKRQRQIASGELVVVPPSNRGEGSMLKAIKITMGICLGLFLFYLLFIAGAVVLFGIFPSKW